MADDDDIDAEFRRLTEGLVPERHPDTSTLSKPSRASMREVKREAKQRQKAAARGDAPVPPPAPQPKPPKAPAARKPARRRSTEPRPEMPRAFMYGPADQLTPTVVKPRSRARAVVLGGVAVLLLGVMVYQYNHGDRLFASPPSGVEEPAPDYGIGRPPPGTGEQDAPLRTPPKVADEPGRYAFIATQTGSAAPVAYDPCRAIHYVVRTSHEPAQGKKLIAQALATVSKATGLTFVDDGATTEIPVSDRAPYQPTKYGGRWAPVLIGWATKAENPGLASPVIGRAGSFATGILTGPQVYVTGDVALSSEWYAAVLRTPHGYAQAEAVLLHELGHLVGLQHVADRSQIMYEMERPKVTAYGVGDLAGLARLGGGACEPRV